MKINNNINNITINITNNKLIINYYIIFGF